MSGHSNSRSGSIVIGVAALGILGALLWFGGQLSQFGGPSEPFDITQIVDSPEASDPVEQAPPTTTEPVATDWSCYWSPTMNDDWHDDVLCTRGLESDRPILLPEQDFVTEEDMMVAAEAYQAQLND